MSDKLNNTHSAIQEFTAEEIIEQIQDGRYSSDELKQIGFIAEASRALSISSLPARDSSNNEKDSIPKIDFYADGSIQFVELDRSDGNVMRRVQMWLEEADLTLEEWKALTSIIRNSRAVSNDTIIKVHSLNNDVESNLPDTRVELYSDEGDEPKLVAIVGSRKNGNKFEE